MNFETMILYIIVIVLVAVSLLTYRIGYDDCVNDFINAGARTDVVSAVKSLDRNWEISKLK
jgi:hypothetical protein